MKLYKLSDMHRGWLIGNFEPSILKTEGFEVGVLHHPKGEVWPEHYHKVATEYNILLSGSMNVCDTELKSGDIFVIEPMEVASPTFHEDCTILCIKIPSSPSDKYIVE